MHKTDIEILNKYSAWADNQILNAAEGMTVAEFTCQVTPDPGWHSLRGTLVHTLDTQLGWRVALQELPDSGVIKEEDFPDVASLKARWQEEHAAWIAYISELNEALLNEVWWRDGEVFRTRWQTILHVINDSTHHRSEAAAILTGYNLSPGELDFDRYLVEQL